MLVLPLSLEDGHVPTFLESTVRSLCQGIQDSSRGPSVAKINIEGREAVQH